MTDLSSHPNIKKLDTDGMYDKIFHFPEQLEDAVEIGRGITQVESRIQNIKNITLAGMGGSAIAGDLIGSCLSKLIPVPFSVCRNYSLPNYIDNSSLVIVSSYSGNTEETLSAMKNAIDRKANVVCLTTGGRIGEIADEKSYRLIRLPQGYPPRAALGFSFIPLLYLFHKVFRLDDPLDSIIKTAARLKSNRQQYSVDTETGKNPARSLAQKLYGKIPIIYTGPDLTGPVGTRWKGQICENAKCPAFCNQYPEFNHNELVGWKVVDKLKNNMIVINIHDNDDSDRIKKRMGIVKGQIEDTGVEVIDIQSPDGSPLERIFSLIQLGDFLSFFLAILNNVDPTPVKAIDYLKEKMED
jgi:glucose/mannose-6-phosphate isomerase